MHNAKELTMFRTNTHARGIVILALGLGLSLGSTAAIAQADAPSATPSVATSSTGAAASADSTSTPDLPYRVAGIGTSERKVLAHYFPPFPVSLDNKAPADDYYGRNYLNPDGEGGKFKSVGGFLRDRPLGRAPISGDYKLQDALTEVKQAQSASVDGFTVDILSWSGANWDRSLLMARAATQSGTGFVTVPNIDMTAGAGSASIEDMAAKLNDFYNQGSAYRLADGRYVLSSFKAEVQPAAWWAKLAAELETTYGKKTAFVGVFLEINDTRIRDYAPISYALSIWGLRTAASVKAAPDWATKVHAAGAKWMAPVAVQDVRHVAKRYAESNNTETLRASWTRAIGDKSELVQMITWNDYSESTQFAPSAAHGRAFLDLSGYYATQFKQGASPSLTGDELVVTHRVQEHQTQPTDQSGTMDWTLSGTKTTPRNTVEVVSLLSKPGQVTAQVGSETITYEAAAGLSAQVLPLGVGTVSATLQRGTTPVLLVTSAQPVRSSVTRWDLQYYAASAQAKGSANPEVASSPQPSVTPSEQPSTSAPTTAPPTTNPPAPVSKQVVVTAGSDGYANATAPKTAYGKSSAMASRGGKKGYASYLKFTLPQAPAGSKLVEAALTVHTTTESFAGSSGKHQVKATTNSWTERDLTWKKRPALGSTVGQFTTKSAADALTSAAVNTTALATSAGKTVSFGVTSKSSDNLWFWSRSHSNTDFRPTLVLTYQIG